MTLTAGSASAVEVLVLLFVAAEVPPWNPVPSVSEDEDEETAEVEVESAAVRAEADEAAAAIARAAAAARRILCMSPVPILD